LWVYKQCCCAGRERREKSHFQRKAHSLNEKLGQSTAFVSSVTGKRESRIEFLSHSERGPGDFSVPESCAVLRWPEIFRNSGSLRFLGENRSWAGAHHRARGRSVLVGRSLTCNSLLSFAPFPWCVNEKNLQISHLPTCLHRSLYDVV